VWRGRRKEGLKDLRLRSKTTEKTEKRLPVTEWSMAVVAAAAVMAVVVVGKN